MTLMAIANGAQDSEMAEVEITKDRFATGFILPPPDIKAAIDKTADAVSHSANPILFEERIRESKRTDVRFSFLNPSDPYHAYYRHKMDRIAQGDTGDAEAAAAKEKEERQALERAQATPALDIGMEMPESTFILDIPNVSAVDMDRMKLTALFTASRGREFLAALSTKEGRNYQFDFLRPTHNLFGYFNRLVEQYTKVLHPQKDMLEALQRRSDEGAKWIELEKIRKYAKWERYKREIDLKRQHDHEAEKKAFAEIDWHDYAIVQTIEFTAADATSELPPPMTVAEVEQQTLTQKRMAAIILENSAEDVKAHEAKVAAAEAAAAAAAAEASNANGDAMDESDDESEEREKREELERVREIARAKAMKLSASNTGGPMKIRTDYVPKLGAKKSTATTVCTICGQNIPVDEIDEHMRIELLDPRWKTQRDNLEQRKAQQSELQRGANVVSSLKNLAKARVDIFGAEADEEKRKADEAADEIRRKERERRGWDGHTASKEGTISQFQTTVNFEEQIAAIHRAKGLGAQDANAIGPGIGPAAIPPPLSAGHSILPAPSAPTYAAATVFSGPQPASALPPPGLTPQFSGIDHAFAYQPVAPGAGGPTAGMHPARLAAMAAGGPSGTIRAADEMEMDGEGPPPAKRQKVARLPGGQMYPEEHWINIHPHPITIQVQMPMDATKAEWKLDGSLVTIPDLPLTLLVSTLRDRILQNTGSAVPASYIRLTHNGNFLKNSNSIAVTNMEEDDIVIFSVSNPKKKK